MVTIPSLRLDLGALPARRLALLRLLGVALCCLQACKKDDVGKACTNPNALLVGDAIAEAGVNTFPENFYRNPDCTSFLCLTEGGLPAYCTRSCTVEPAAAGAAACADDRGCSAPLQCFAGTCRSDDCPRGFACKVVQEVGDNANKTFCIRRTCASDLDCGNIGKIGCTTVGCRDRCLQDPGCAAHVSTCDPVAELGCNCVGGAATCADSALVCQPPGVAAPLPAGAVTRKNVCIGAF